MTLARLEFIRLLDLPIILKENSFNPPIILKIIPTEIDLLTKIHANMLINTKRITVYTITNNYLNRDETLSTEKDVLNCSHGNNKNLIVGLRLIQ